MLGCWDVWMFGSRRRYRTARALTSSRGWVRLPSDAASKSLLMPHHNPLRGGRKIRRPIVTSPSRLHRAHAAALGIVAAAEELLAGRSVGPRFSIRETNHSPIAPFTLFHRKTPPRILNSRTPPSNHWCVRDSPTQSLFRKSAKYARFRIIPPTFRPSIHPGLARHIILIGTPRRANENYVTS